MAPADEHQLVGFSVDAPFESVDVGGQVRMHQFDGARGCAQDLVETVALEFAEPESVRVLAYIVECEAAGS